jgi:hypothetical protein
MAAGCSTGGHQGTRLVILPFENLSLDPNIDWMARGFAEDLRLQLSGTPANDAVFAASRRDVPGLGAARIVEGYFAVRNGRLRATAVVADADNQHARRTASGEGPLGAGMLPVADALARQIDPAARPLPTRRAEAWREFIGGLANGGDRSSPPGGVSFQRAVSADPEFPSAYLAWIEALLAAGNRAGAMEAAAAARTRAAGFPALERARLDVLAASLANDRAAHRRALERFASAAPADPAPLRALAELETAAHAYGAAAAKYEKALDDTPGDGELANSLGYARLWAGDFDGAVRAFMQYRQRWPDEANPLDSLADAHYYFSRFDDAARLYLEAHSKNPAFLGGGELYKAAWARLMAGAPAEADALFSRFLKARETMRDPLAAYRQAQWECLTGRRLQALARLEALAKSPQPALASLASAQLAIWFLDAGDRARALVAVSQTPARTPLKVASALLAQPPASPVEWAARFSREFPAPEQASLRRDGLAYALLYSQQFAAAVPLLEEMERATIPSSADQPGVPLAWALIETGHADRAAGLLRFNPAPDPIAEHPFLSLSFPRVLELRAEIARREGRKADAERYSALFRRYSGAQ